MPPLNELITSIRTTYRKGGYTSIFTEILGWDTPSESKFTLNIDSEAAEVNSVAALKGFSFYEVILSSQSDATVFRKIEFELSKRSPESLVIFRIGNRQKWRWPRRNTKSGSSYEIIEFDSDELPEYLCQRLAALKVTVSQRNALSSLKVLDLVSGQFETEKVTKKFYEDFYSQHLSLSSEIQGLGDEKLQSEYASLMLNRLMFMYFFEKKGFLNGDFNYLRNSLESIEKLNGQDKFYSFYKDLLLPIFFEGLNAKKRPISHELSQIIGDIPYVNGGIFTKNQLEKENDISIPDSAFKEIFDFFDSYSWHLDTRPGGNSNEINPDVLGYIFEQYINYASSGKRESGAYYTPTDLSFYMVSQTVVPKIIDFLLELGHNPFKILRTQPRRYFSRSMMFGYNFDIDSWEEIKTDLQKIYSSNPLEWGELDATDSNSELCLPDETWVETFHRRERVQGTLEAIEKGEVKASNDLITHNLNSLLLVQDYLESLRDKDAQETIWKRLEQLSILDPTCGSGAFLFSALEVLESVYQSLLSGIRASLEEEWAFLASESLERVLSAKNLRYAIRKHIALHNLFGNDIMAEAIETAKLRIFLSLVACLSVRSELEPLPDLDFNLKVGNLLVGLANSADIERIGGDLFSHQSVESLYPEIRSLEADYKKFISETQSGIESEKTRVALSKSLQHLREKVNLITSECLNIDGKHREKWLEEIKPMNWFIEFPSVMSNGGFDVIVGNPPYIRMSEIPIQELESFVGYQCAGSPDLYAICYERTFSLLNEDGRHGFVVMLSLAFSEKFDSLREVISKTESTEWWSTYAKRPDSLFAGVQVRNTVLILGPGDSSYTTHHRLFSKKSRPHLFGVIEYVPSARCGSQPPRRGGVANPILDHIVNIEKVASGIPSSVVFRGRATYWFPVLPSVPPVVTYQDLRVIDVKDNLVRSVRKPDGVSDALLVAALGGKIGYLLWSALQDDLNCTEKTIDFACSLVSSLSSASLLELEPIANQVKSKIKNSVFVVNNAKSGYLNIRWIALRAYTDMFDYRLLCELGLEPCWKPLNVWYRSVMKASRDSTNSRTLSIDEVTSLVDW